MIFVPVSICTVFLGLILIFINFFKYDKDFKCDWKRCRKIFNLSIPAIISVILATLILIGIILFVSLSFLLESNTALKGVVIFSVSDLLVIGIIKILFIVIDRVRYNFLLTKYIKRTFNIEEKNWQPEDPIEAEDAIFEYKDIKRKIEKITKQSENRTKGKT